MPVQKDLKRLVRSRMEKTGESYTAARLQIVTKHKVAQPSAKPPTDYAALAGMSDAPVRRNTGRGWAEWVETLDAIQAAGKPHREIAEYVASLGTPDWWSQTVTVGYERIRGLREKGQRREGSYEANKSRTFAVDVATLFDAFANTRIRNRWLTGVKVQVRTAHKPRAIRMGFDDGTLVIVGFYPRGEGKSQVAVQHTKLASKADAEKMKAFWSERFDALSERLTKSR
jgi:hypothetical protein